MIKCKGFSKLWFLVVLLVAFVAGCTGNDNNSANAITAFSLGGVTGTINNTAKTISVAMPNGTPVTALIATFITTGASVTAGTPAVAQTSGTTTNDFTNPVPYTVIAADGTPAIYTVTVTVAQSFTNAITAFSFVGFPGAAGTITTGPATNTIAVTMPNGTDISALSAVFTTSAGTTVKVGGSPQVSGTSTQNFTNSVTSPVVYTVIAADGTTQATYAVTVTLASSTADAITAYSLKGVTGTIATPVPGSNTITVTLPKGTAVTALVATFTTTGASVTAGTPAVAQTSGTTPNDFTSPVAYTVTAADGTTQATYTVTVTLAAAAGPTPVNLGTAGNFVILAKSAVSTTGTTKVVGDIGVSPAAAGAITGFTLIADATNTFSTSSLVTGKIYAANFAPPTPANMTAAISDMQTAFTDAAGRTLPDFTDLGPAGNITGLTLVPGLYKWGTGVTINSGGVTLTGSATDVWIFQIANNLTVNNSAIVTLSGGALAKNVFWQVAGQATLGTAADFKGIILSQTLISLNTGAKMTGRALAQTAVTLNATAITAP
jgi:hypothetical protein